MKRREFLTAGLAAGAAAAAAAGTATRAHAAPAGGAKPFNHLYAPHFGMFREHAGDDLVDQLEFMAEQGFRALEDNGMKGRSEDDQARVGEALQRLGMTMGVFVAHANFNEVTCATERRSAVRGFLQDIENSIPVAKRVNAKWMTVVPGRYDPGLEWDYQTHLVIENLKRAAEILEPHGLVMVLEPLNPFRDHPGLFLTKIAQAYMICKAVASPSCKILDDLYHQQITEGNLIPNLDRAWDEIPYYQVGDNPGRREPTTGEVNYKNIFKHLHQRGYTGVIGMEHGKSRPGKEGEERLIAAYREVDDFLEEDA